MNLLTFLDLEPGSSIWQFRPLTFPMLGSSLLVERNKTNDHHPPWHTFLL